MLSNEWKKVKEVLKKGGTAVVPTDTLYGIVACALDKKAVRKVYAIRKRNEKKPCIILIHSFSDFKKFGIVITKDQKTFLDTIWPGKVSVILPISNSKFSYLHRGTKTIAFRMIGQKNNHLFELIKSVGPLIAPSANPEGLMPARNRREARAYFGDTVDAYVCYGKRDGKPSTLVSIQKNEIKVLREGAVKIKFKAQKK